VTLEQALAIFEQLGAPLWAEKARAELRRIGGRAPSRGELTEAERRIAGLVAEGRTNREVAAALFVTEHTVEGGGRDVFSRLRGRLGGGCRRGLPARGDRLGTDCPGGGVRPEDEATRGLRPRLQGDLGALPCPSFPRFSATEVRVNENSGVCSNADVPADCKSSPRETTLMPYLQGFLKPTPGLEPGTPSLRVKCSTS
jgi:DNA-binding CsgD family transcriptional regulator